MNIVTMHGTDPDGQPLEIEVDLDLPDDDMCPAASGESPLLVALCTLPLGHPGPWHVATTGAEIVRVWPTGPVWEHYADEAGWG